MYCCCSTRRYKKPNKKTGSPCLFSRHNADKHGYYIKVTFGDLRAQQLSAIIFQCSVLILHRVRLSSIFYSSTSQKKMFSNTLHYFILQRKHNLATCSVGPVMSLCNTYFICQKSSHRFLPFFSQLLRILFSLNL